VSGVSLRAGSERVIEMVEEMVKEIPADRFSEEEGLLLHRLYGKQIGVEFPGPLIGENFRLRSRGFVGKFPLGRGVQLEVRPKVPVKNLFAMLEHAYGLERFDWEGKPVRIETIPQVFEFLASILARGTLARLQGGLFQEYVEREDEISWVKGRLQPPLPQRKIEATMRCRFSEQTEDLMENRILAWTLAQLRRFPFSRAEVRGAVGRAGRLLAKRVTPTPVSPEDCQGRNYHRLNHDYRLLHGLCRFFLEQGGPALGEGRGELMPFSLHMPTLFEKFVAEWLREHLRMDWVARIQHRVPLEGSPRLAFKVDLALEERGTGRIAAVLDTKYKRDFGPEERDIQQVVAYAVRMGTETAFLVYPTPDKGEQSLKVGPVQVHSLGFDLGGDFDRVGKEVVEKLRRCLGREKGQNR
jgi:5-methylcytosine-specific restriction enzyme subunit McrC